MANSTIQAFGGSAMNGGVRPDDLKKLNVYHPGHVLPFSTYDPVDETDTDLQAIDVAPVQSVSFAGTALTPDSVGNVDITNPVPSDIVTAGTVVSDGSGQVSTGHPVEIDFDFQAEELKYTHYSDFDYKALVPQVTNSDVGKQLVVEEVTKADGSDWKVPRWKRLVLPVTYNNDLGQWVYPLYSDINALITLGVQVILRRSNPSGQVTYWYVDEKTPAPTSIVFVCPTLGQTLSVTSSNTWTVGYYRPDAESIADEYDDAAIYDVGDYCMHAGLLYVCNTQISVAESWTAGHWTLKSVTDIIGQLKNGRVLTDADLIEVPNNKYFALSTGRAAVELRVNVADGEVPNFAVEIAATGAVTLTVSAQFSTGAPVTLYPSVAGGNALESGKFYQVTCVGNCWTLAEFTNTP